MKHSGLFIFFISIFFMNLQAQNFTIKPEKPKPGDKITITLEPSGTAVEKSQQLEAFVYLYNTELKETKSTEMKKEGNVWTGSFTSTKDALGALVAFRDDEIEETNKKKGYVIHFYDKKGNILPGSLAGLGYANYSWGSYYAGLDRNAELAFELMNKDFEKNPSVKKDFIVYYAPVAMALNKENSEEIMKDAVKILDKKKSFTENEYAAVIDYSKKLQDTLTAQKYEKAALNKYPGGMIVQIKEAEKFSKLSTQEEKVSAAREFASKYPDSRYLPGMHNQIIRAYTQATEYEKLRDFILANKQSVHPYYLQNTASKIIEQNGDLNTALEIASAGIEVFPAFKKKDKKPEYLSEKQWRSSQNELEGGLLFTKGKALYAMDKKQEALDLFQTAAAKMEYKDADVNLFYSKALMDEGHYDEAFDQLSKFIKEGNSKSEMNNLLAAAYEKVKGNSNGFNVFLTGLEKEANKKIIAKLEGEMINEPAPDFKLVDLQGKEVSLSELKGKVVIVDFWATWCGPCIQSFPGMKMAVDKYSSKDDIKFLFVNTWERVENKKQNAEDFIAKNAYPFQVLMDYDNKVIESYKVSGIPTKFIIDKGGNIRFKSVGYSGNNDKMVAEIDAMISMLN
jgi:peroxiredoxin